MKKSTEKKALDFSKKFLNNGDNSEFEAQAGYLGFLKGYQLAQKESEAIFETERQYWLDKEATDLRTNTEIINSKYSAEEALELLLKANDNAPDFGWGREGLEEWFNTIKK